jgi:hypothetical protein
MLNITRKKGTKKTIKGIHSKMHCIGNGKYFQRNIFHSAYKIVFSFLSSGWGKDTDIWYSLTGARELLLSPTRQQAHSDNNAQSSDTKNKPAVVFCRE